MTTTFKSMARFPNRLSTETGTVQGHVQGCLRCIVNDNSKLAQASTNLRLALECDLSRPSAAEERLENRQPLDCIIIEHPCFKISVVSVSPT